MKISRSFHVGAHLATIMFHMVVAILVYTFASDRWHPNYNRFLGLLLLGVSMMAIVPILQKNYPIQID